MLHFQVNRNNTARSATSATSNCVLRSTSPLKWDTALVFSHRAFRLCVINTFKENKHFIVLLLLFILPWYLYWSAIYKKNNTEIHKTSHKTRLHLDIDITYITKKLEKTLRQYLDCPEIRKSVKCCAGLVSFLYLFVLIKKTFN